MQDRTALKIALASVLMLGWQTPGIAGCLCKNTRVTWCATACDVCWANQSAPVGRCLTWHWKQRHPS